MPWLHVNAGPNGSGAGTISYSVDANLASNARSGSISIAGAGTNVRFNVYQAGAACLAESDDCLSPVHVTNRYRPGAPDPLYVRVVDRKQRLFVADDRRACCLRGHPVCTVLGRD